MPRQKPTERQRQARALEALGFLDGPAVRYFLRGDVLEVWRRECRCAEECDCWELAAPIPATEAHREAFFLAERPMAAPLVAAPAGEGDAIGAAAERAQSAPRWRPLFPEDAR